MCVTHGMAYVNMRDTFEGYKYGLVHRGGEQQEGKGRKKKKKRKERKEREEKKRERERKRSGKRKEPVGFPLIDDASTDRIYRTEKKSSSTQ